MQPENCNIINIRWKKNSSGSTSNFEKYGEKPDLARDNGKKIGPNSWTVESYLEEWRGSHTHMRLNRPSQYTENDWKT